MLSSSYDVIDLTVSLSIRKKKSKCMNVAMWEHHTFDRFYEMTAFCVRFQVLTAASMKFRVL
jgi:hypothetical protein